MSERVFWWQTSDPSGGSTPVNVAVLAPSLSAATKLARGAGFHGLKGREERGKPPEWVREVPEAHPGQVCWSSDDCVAPDSWSVAPPA